MKKEDVVVSSMAQEVKVPVSVPLRVPRGLGSHPAMGRGLRSNKPIKAWLAWYTAGTGAVNTAFAANFAIQPNQDSSWASWQATFDEVKVLEAEAHWNVFYVADPTAMPANSSNTILVYDPTSTVTLTSVNAGLQFERFGLCRNMIPTASGPKVSPMVTTKDGFNKFRAKIPAGPQLSAVNTANSPGLWRPTGDATNYDWGTFATYTSVGGATSQLRVEIFVRMLCEFRVRR